MPIALAHRLAQAPRRRAQEGHRSTSCAPTARRQVSVRYEDDRPVGIDTVVVSTQHAEDVKYKTLQGGDHRGGHQADAPRGAARPKTKFFINPTGRFVVGGPMGDSGLTGRKIIVDTYGGMGRHGGGAFSGKDPSKVDRSACYYARYIAKNVVAAELARRCEVQLAYAIGVAEPVSIDWSAPSAPARSPKSAIERARPRALRLPPGRAHPRARPAAPDLPQDRGLRPLRPQREGVHLGAAEQGRCPGRRRALDPAGALGQRQRARQRPRAGRQVAGQEALAQVAQPVDARQLAPRRPHRRGESALVAPPLPRLSIAARAHDARRR